MLCAGREDYSHCRGTRVAGQRSVREEWFLRRFKDDVREVMHGYECGIGLEKFNDIKEGDVIEAFYMEKIERSL